MLAIASQSAFSCFIYGNVFQPCQNLMMTHNQFFSWILFFCHWRKLDECDKLLFWSTCKFWLIKYSLFTFFWFIYILYLQVRYLGIALLLIYLVYNPYIYNFQVIKNQLTLLPIFSILGLKSHSPILQTCFSVISVHTETIEKVYLNYLYFILCLYEAVVFFIVVVIVSLSF